MQMFFKIKNAWQSNYSPPASGKGPSIYDARMEEGSGSREHMWSGGHLHVDIHTENQRPQTTSCRFLMQRGLRYLDQNFLFGRNKNWIFSTNLI